MSSCVRVPKPYPAQLHSQPLGIEPEPAAPIHMLWFGKEATKAFCLTFRSNLDTK